MNTMPANPWVLEDLLADLVHARRNQDLGRLALLAYCEVKSWARQTGKTDIADWATRMFTENPCVSREDFLAKIDTLITALGPHRQAGPMTDATFARPEAAPGNYQAH